MYQRVVDNLPLSINNLEGWHRGFYISLNSYDPRVYKSVDTVKLEQSFITKINSCMRMRFVFKD